MAYESGIRGLRAEFFRETVRGVTDADPDWLLFSDAVQNFTVTPTGSINPRGNIGSPDVVNFNAGTESHEFSITYDLQRWFTAAGDAAFDGMSRLADGSLPKSHSVVARAAAGHTGTAGAGSRIYYVATGSLINSVTLAGEPESGEPVMVTLNYLCEKMRAYLIDQPLTDTTLTLTSTEVSDTMNYTIENDGATQTETAALTGTTPKVTTETYTSIDAIWFDAEPLGDITITDGTNTLCVIYGKGSAGGTGYQGREGDQGIPPLGAGSHGSAIGTAYENILGDTITRGGSALGLDADISSVSMSVENAVEANSTVYAIGKVLSEGARTINLNATIFGPKASFDAMEDHLKAVESNIVWTMSGGTLTLTGAALVTMGNIARETYQAVMTVDNTFQGKTLTIA
jgi:hypothetical protein